EERALHDAHDARDVRARCDLRHHAAEHAVHILREDDERAHARLVTGALDHGRRGLVARGLDAEEAHHRPCARCTRITRGRTPRARALLPAGSSTSLDANAITASPLPASAASTCAMGAVASISMRSRPLPAMSARTLGSVSATVYPESSSSSRRT